MNSTNFYNEIGILSLCCQGLLGARDIVLSPLLKLRVNWLPWPSGSAVICVPVAVASAGLLNK